MLIFDGHCDSLSIALTDKISLNEQALNRQFDFVSALGVTDFQTMAIFIDKEPREKIAFGDFAMLQRHLVNAVEQNEQVELITVKEQLKNWSKGKLGVLMAVEGAEILEGSISRLEEIFALGARSLTFTWNNDNALAGGCMQENASGLTALGKEVLKRMNQLGMAADIAHLAPKGVSDVLRLTNAPVIDSHGCCAALFKHPRNLSDEQIKALALSGGVLGITYVAKFLREPYQLASVDDVVDHIAHAALLVGVEHVGLGSDFDGVDFKLSGLSHVSEVPNLVDKLRRKGFHQAEIEKIMGGNFLRVYEEILP